MDGINIEAIAEGLVALISLWIAWRVLTTIYSITLNSPFAPPRWIFQLAIVAGVLVVIFTIADAATG